MRRGMLLATFFFVLGILVALVQMWFTPWDAAFFLKLELTFAALFLIVLVVNFVIKEHRENEVTKSGENLDD